MASLASRSERDAQAKRPQLFLLFTIGADRYALDAREVVEVTALRALKQLPGAPVWVAGLVNHRGWMVPVLDLAARAGMTAARDKTSTRLVLVHYQGRHADESAPVYLLGLILEQATDTLRCLASDFQDYGVDNSDSPYLGPVLKHPLGLIQRITIAQLLPDEVHARLFEGQAS
jgi:chemotaxis-related protein WspB